MASLYEITKGEDVELYRVLSQAGADAELARSIIRRPELATMMISAVRELLAPSMFSTPQEVFDRFVGYANEQNWPFFGTDQIEELHQRMPISHTSSIDRLLALDIWLGDLPNTFQALAGWIAHEQSKVGNGFWRWDKLKFDSEHLRLLNPDRYGDKPSVHWVELDMTANRGTRPKDVRNPEKSAGLQVMSAFAAHPNYPPTIDYDKTPGAWAAGIQVTIPGEGAWADVPILGWGSGGREVDLGAGWDGRRHGGCAVPVVREL